MTHNTILALIAVVGLSMQAAAAEGLDDLERRLHDEYTGSFAEARSDLPFTVRAWRDEGRISSAARFLLEGARFEDLVDVLGGMQGWCQSLLLHFNVKTCVHDETGDESLTLYLGRKYYQHPADSIRFVFDFERAIADGVMRATLTAEKGPYGTSGYVFVLGAVRVDEGVFVELLLSTRQGYSDTIVDLYLNTLGRSKVGFTRDGETVFGNPRYVGGREGAAERNVVRYMLALRASLELEDEPFMRRAEGWFEATERYPRQLHELEREEYLEIKRREFENQLAYQSAVERGESVERHSPGKDR